MSQRLKPRLKAAAAATRPASAGPRPEHVDLDPRRRVLWAARPLRRGFNRWPNLAEPLAEPPAEPPAMSPTDNALAQRLLMVAI